MCALALLSALLCFAARKEQITFDLITTRQHTSSLSLSLNPQYVFTPKHILIYRFIFLLIGTMLID